MQTDFDFSIFALIDSDLFNATPIDSASTIERINRVDDYRSLNEIV